MSSKIKASVAINLPVNQVYELFLDKSHFKDWKKDYKGYEHLSGTPGEMGAVTKLMYKRQIMIETITGKKIPAEIIANYEHQQGGKTNMYHTVSNYFTAVTPTTTLLEVEMEITKVIGVFLKLMMALMSGAGKKYVQTQLNQLKALAEKN